MELSDIINIFCIILVICLAIYGSIYIAKIMNDIQQEANCKALNKNGHNTHIEILWMYGLPFKDCYIQTETGISIPYDRFIGIKEVIK